MSFPQGATTAYITGGTASYPRVIYYSPQRWEQAIEAKARMFADYSIGEGDLGAICTPFEPWSIGRVHLEGALRTGASALPLGLTLATDATLEILASCSPTFICGGARYLAKAGARCKELYPRIKPPNYIFVSGEKLTEELRRKTEAAWGGQVVDVYGMAEFDLVGYERPGKSGVFQLTEQFEYGLLERPGVITPTKPNRSGELCIRRRQDEDWFPTGDFVTVRGQSDHTSHARQVSVCFEHRIDVTVSLGEGSFVSEKQLTALSKLFDIEFLQLHVVRQDRADLIRLLLPRDFPQSDNEVVKALFNLNLDLADAVTSSAIELIVSRCSQDELKATERGKQPLVVEVKDDVS